MAKALLKRADIQRIKQTITEADNQTGCEIVAVIAESSGRYDRAEDIFGLVCAIVFLTAAWLGWPFLQSVQMADGAWADSSAGPFGLLVIIPIIIGGFVLGACLATWFPPLKTLFIARREMSDEVAKAAQSWFYETGLRNADNGAGILIYVSRYERMVQIIGDEAAAAHLQDNDWNEFRDLLIEGLKKRNEVGGFINAITLMSDRLAGAFLK